MYRKIYIAEENVGLWEINVDLEVDLDKKLILSVDEKYFKSDFEGVTLYEKDDGEGYIIVSIQGSNSFGIIDRKTKKILSVFRIISNKNIDEVSDTDGIDLAKLSSNKFP
jgi:3-phytase